MKFLIIDNGQVLFTTDPSIQASNKLDQITKDDLLKLIDLCVSDPTFEMDSYDENLIHNKAHQIIYKNLYQKFDDLIKQRIRFSDEKSTLYKVAIEKYSSESSN